ncbi:MAG: RND transporter, partial [Nitrospiria bacterium]
MTYAHSKLVIGTTVMLTVIAVYGISQIRINDNPIKWFNASHPIRVADRVLNDHFGGTYMAYLTLEQESGTETAGAAAERFIASLEANAEDSFVPMMAEVSDEVIQEVKRLEGEVESEAALLQTRENYVNEKLDTASFENVEVWEEVLFLIDQQHQQGQVFKQPEVLRFMSDLQDHLLSTGIVGKSNSLADVVKTVHRELFLGEAAAYRIPDSAGAVAQTLITYQNSHRPQDLWHFVTPDYLTSSTWVQLKSGDNIDMAKVVESVDQFIRSHPGDLPLKHRWFGLTYI